MKNIYLLVLIPLILVLIWFRNGNIMGGGESGLPFYDLGKMLEIPKHAWAEPALGNGVGIGIAATPTYWILSQLQNLGIPSYFIQGLFLAISFLIAGLSVYLLTKEIFPNIGNKCTFLAVFFYWFNPFSLVNVWNRFLNNYMFFWSLLPLVLYLYLKGIREKKIIYAIVVSLVCGIFSYALTSIPFNLILWGIFAYTSIFYLFFSKTKSERIFILSYFFTTLACFVLINFWWISQLFAFVISPQIRTVTSEFFKSNDNLSTLNSLSASLGKNINNFKLLHGTFSVNSVLWWANIYNIWPVSLLLFVPTTVVFWVIYYFRRNKEILYLGILFVLSLFLVKGSAPPFGEIFEFIFIKVQVFQVFRNPFEKFGFLLPLVFAPLLSFGLYELSQKYRRFEKWLNFSVLFIVVGVMGFPFWTGLVFTNAEGKNGKIQSYEVKVPDYYKDVNNWLNNQLGEFRFISLPLGGEGITYTWPKPYSGVELSSTFFDTPNISFNTSVPYYNQLVGQIEKYQLDENILRFAPFTNTKYIVLRKDIDFKRRGMANPDTVEKKLDEWIKRGLIEKKYASGQLSIYEIANRWFWPKIYSTPEIYLSNSKDSAFLSGFFEGFPQKKNVVMDVSNISSNLAYKKAIYVPDKTHLQPVTSPLPKDLTDGELLGKLFYAKHLPGDLVYPLIRINEKIFEIREKDTDGLILYKVGVLGKRVAEIYKLSKLGKSADLITNTQKDYENELSSMSPSITALIEKGGPIASVVKDSLMYQWVLLGRVGLSSTTALLSDLLSKWNVKPTFEVPPSTNAYMIANFKLPVDGNYLLYGAEKGKVFIDGKELMTGKNVPIELKSGIHEVSLNLKDNEIYKSIVDQPGYIYIDQNNSQHWDFEIPDTPQKYQIEFDYRFDTGKRFGVKVVQDLEDDVTPSFSSGVGFNPNYYGWQHYDQEMGSTLGATKAYLSFSSVEEAFCNKLWWGWTKCGKQSSKFGVEIRNLKIREIDTPELSLVMNGDAKNDFSSGQTSFEEINPTSYKVHIDKSNNNPEVLVFSELYSSSWKLSYANGERFPDSSHFLVNDYANGWIISRSGSYDLLINFAPQKTLEFGGKVSLYSVVTAIILLILYALWQKKHEVS